MKNKILANSLIGLAVLLAALGAYELNQYANANASTSIALQKLNEFSSDAALLQQLGMSASDIQSTKQLAEVTLNSFLLAALADFVAAVILFLAGYALHPKKE
ncbi:MAG: hypothetical protein ACP5O3_01935 [Candidatus Micrarchaeia archaeon]|jgi:hypothetical protein